MDKRGLARVGFAVRLLGIVGCASQMYWLVTKGWDNWHAVVLLLYIGLFGFSFALTWHNPYARDAGGLYSTGSLTGIAWFVLFGTGFLTGVGAILDWIENGEISGFGGVVLMVCALLTPLALLMIARAQPQRTSMDIEQEKAKGEARNV